MGHASIQADLVPGLAPDGCNPEIAREPVCSPRRNCGLGILGDPGPPVLPYEEWDLAFNERVILAAHQNSPGTLASPQVCPPPR